MTALNAFFAVGSECIELITKVPAEEIFEIKQIIVSENEHIFDIFYLSVRRWFDLSLAFNMCVFGSLNLPCCCSIVEEYGASTGSIDMVYPNRKT